MQAINLYLIGSAFFAWLVCDLNTGKKIASCLYHNCKQIIICKIIRKDVKMNILGNYKKWRTYRRTVDELSALSTRELNDLGISRTDIRQVAKRGN